MDSRMLPQAIAHNPVLYRRNESNMINLVQQKFNAFQVVAPVSPVCSRPGSSSSTMYSNASALLTPTGCAPSISHHKPAIMLETEFADSPYFPSTPPLSTSGSAVGSPKNYDVLQTPLNPMFSGLDGFAETKPGLESTESSILDWTSCGSPPMTPVFIHSQPSRVPSLSSTTSDLSAVSCPSLSPSPAPYAKSATSEIEVDFCDPRNLTVSVTSIPTPATSFAVSSLGDEEFGCLEQGSIDASVLSRPTFDFSQPITHGLPCFEELSDFESEDDVNNLVSFGEVCRPRACTGSSVVSLGHGSFIGDEDFSLDEHNSFDFTLPSPPSSVEPDEDAHKDKRQKKISSSCNNANTTPTTANNNVSSSQPIMTTAAVDNDQPASGEEQMDQASPAPSDSNASCEDGDTPANSVPAPTNRRGRKQSLTEDPSKTFVCDLCNRRFRRQEHLKRHYRSLHTQEKPFECGECGKKFSRSDNLAQHARTHATGGAMVMSLNNDNIDASSAYEGGMAAPAIDDYANYGKVLFQIASEVPGSASELSSDETSDSGKKKRKRSD
ncbi:hypothetical protein E4U55_005591 [Claviceps digitariae]|nr:hypothetical protein E4U55_005591 [Claviceps digitariae]